MGFFLRLRLNLRFISAALEHILSMAGVFGFLNIAIIGISSDVALMLRKV